MKYSHFWKTRAGDWARSAPRHAGSLGRCPFTGIDRKWPGHGRNDAIDRRARLDDTVSLSKLFASAFMDDPLFDHMVRPGARRTAALEMFFHEILWARDIPQGEVWMSSDGHACVCWLSPDARRSPGGLVQKLSWLPFFVRVFSPARFTRGMAIMEAMEKNHPREHHFYLTFIAVSPEYRGVGLGS